MCFNPERRIKAAKFVENESGGIGNPSGRGKTKSLFWYTGPKLNRFSFCFILCSFNTSMVTDGKGTCLRLRSVFGDLNRTPLFVCSKDWFTVIRPSSRFTSFHRKARSSPRRKPVVTAIRGRPGPRFFKKIRRFRGYLPSLSGDSTCR